MKKLKLPVTAFFCLSLVAFNSPARPFSALADEPTFAQQRDAQLRLSRDRIQQLRQQLDRVGTSLDLYPQDYITASRALLDSVEVSLTEFDARVLEIMSRFERPIVEHNQIASSSLSEAQKAIRLLPIDREINGLKEQASADYSAAIRALYDLIPGLPHFAQGSILHSNATAAQKAALGCDAETRHIFKATFTNSSGQELFTGHQCVKASDTSTALPSLAPISAQVRRQFYDQLLLPLLSQHCQSEVCRQFLLLDYAGVFQKVGLTLDQPMSLGFGHHRITRRSTITIPLANPGVITWLVGANLVASSLPTTCRTMLFSGSARPMGMTGPDGVVNSLDHESVVSFFYQDVALRSYRSRADLLVSGAAHLLNLIPVLGQFFYNFHPGGRHYNSSTGNSDEDTGFLNHRSSNQNSEEWRREQVSRTVARCDAELDQNYGGDRDRYTCHRSGWMRSGPRGKMRRERYSVSLHRHGLIVPMLGTTTTTEQENIYGEGGYQTGTRQVTTTTDVYDTLFRNQLAATRSCLRGN